MSHQNKMPHDENEENLILFSFVTARKSDSWLETTMYVLGISPISQQLLLVARCLVVVVGVWSWSKHGTKSMILHVLYSYKKEEYLFEAEGWKLGSRNGVSFSYGAMSVTASRHNVSIWLTVKQYHTAYTNTQPRIALQIISQLIVWTCKSLSKKAKKSNECMHRSSQHKSYQQTTPHLTGIGTHQCNDVDTCAS